MAYRFRMTERTEDDFSAAKIIALLEVFRRVHARLLFPSVHSISRPMSENTLNAALRRLGYSKGEMTAHSFKGMASNAVERNGSLDSRRHVNLHTRNRTMFGALTCTQPNTGRSASR